VNILQPDNRKAGLLCEETLHPVLFLSYIQKYLPVPNKCLNTSVNRQAYFQDMPYPDRFQIYDYLLHKTHEEESV